MKLDVSAKTGGFGRNPHIKKGYYPAQLIKVEKFVDKEGNLREGKYGNQLIMSFKVYNKGENEEPTTEMLFKDDSLGVEVESEVVIPKFVYYIYKDQKTGDMSTAITPNSAITRTFKALGWEFDASKPFDPEDFINSWAEINVSDYERKDKDDKNYTASTIKDIESYSGPLPTVGDGQKDTSEEIEEIDIIDDSDLPQ